MKELALTSLLALTLLATTAFTALPDTAAAPVAPALSDAEAQGLLFMVEEEKLAHDLYLAFFNQYGLRVFENIAASESAHMDAIRSLLSRYGIADPTISSTAGVFSNPDLQALYDGLLSRGSTSLADALKAAAEVEEVDILDLQARAAQTALADIRLIYQNLETASGSHLRAFAGQYAVQTGSTYTPAHLDAQAFQAIMAGANGNGNRGGAAGNGMARGFGGRGRS